MRASRLALALVGAAFLALAACGNDAATADDDNARCLPEAVDCDDTPASGTCEVGATDCADDPSAAPPAFGMCLEGATDCNDMGEGSSDAFDDDAEREAARAMIGMAEADLAPDVRIGRKGGETYALTEDYVLGRKTVELDADADGTFRVTKVTVELLSGPETYTD